MKPKKPKSSLVGYVDVVVLMDLFFFSPFRFSRFDRLHRFDRPLAVSISST
jgi:hypothetical protein